MKTTQSALTLAVVLATTGIGCAGATAQASAPERPLPGERVAGEVGDDSDLPEAIARLGLTTDQRRELEAVRDRFADRTVSANRQRLAFQAAIVGAIEVCDPHFARMRIEGRRMIEAGRGAKPAALDAINELHAVLTPGQRRRLAEAMIERSAERRERSDDEGFAALGKKLDLGVGQVIRMARRARNRMTLSRSDRDALHDMFDEAARQFVEPGFDAHQTALAQEPLVEHVVQFVFDLAAIVLPVLDEQQCRIAADFARERLVDDEAKKADDGADAR